MCNVVYGQLPQAYGDGMAEGRVEVTCMSAVVPISDELLADAQAMGEAIRRWNEKTTEERIAAQRSAAEQRREQRREQRQTAPQVELTIDALVDKLSFSREYAEHLVQPYCECYDAGWDGWEYCEHARDLGFAG